MLRLCKSSARVALWVSWRPAPLQVCAKSPFEGLVLFLHLYRSLQRACGPDPIAAILQISGSSVMVGLALCCISGTSYILFSPAVNLATNDQWHKLAEGVPHLVVYTGELSISGVLLFLSGRNLSHVSGQVWHGV